IHGAVPREATVIVRHSAGHGHAGPVQKLDVDIAEPQGRVCVRLIGLTSRVLEGRPGAQAQTLLFQPQWKAQQPSDLTPGAARYAERWVVLCEAGEHESLGPQVLRLSTQETELAGRYSAYAEQLLGWVQGLVRAKPAGEVLIQLVVPNVGEGEVLRGLIGLLKSVEQETLKISGQVLAIEAGLATQALDQRLQLQ